MNNKRKSIITAILFVLCVLTPRSSMAQTANPEASPDAKKLLKYLSKLPARSEHKMLDDLALGLTPLQKAGVVVLFCPFHEQNGDFFWWGNRGPNTNPTPIQG